jgi:hypothetical protein
MIDIDKYLAQQKAVRLADAALSKAAQPRANSVASHATCLVTSFARRSDVPEGTFLVKMSAKVVNALEIKGLHEPVSLKLLPDLWWVAQVDASMENPNFEAGGATTEVIATTEMLVWRYSSAYCEVTQGPYFSRDEIDGTFFVTETFDRRRLGDRVRLIAIPPGCSRQLAKQGWTEPIPFSALQGKWWVCGLSGGVRKSEELGSAAGSMREITDGPFATKDDADYALDVLWESPE